MSESEKLTSLAQSQSLLDENNSPNFSFIRNVLNIKGKTVLFDAYRVKGIAINFQSPQQSSAMIESVKDNQSTVYYLNRILPDQSRLIEINSDHVVLEKEGIRKRFYINDNAELAVASENKVPDEGYEKLNDKEWTLMPYRAFKDNAKEVLDFSIDGTKTDDGIEGFKIDDFKDDSLLGNLGLQAGDVILKINDSSATSMYECIKAFNNVKLSDELALEVRRGNQNITLKYHLFWSGAGSWAPKDVFSSKAILSLIKNSF
jgi:type II secretion system protein C